MTRLLFLLFFLVGNTAKADTLDYWKIYINHTELPTRTDIGGECPQYLFRLSDVKVKDSFKVCYFRDYYGFPRYTRQLIASDALGNVIVRVYVDDNAEVTWGGKPVFISLKLVAEKGGCKIGDNITFSYTEGPLFYHQGPFAPSAREWLRPFPIFQVRFD